MRKRELMLTDEQWKRIEPLLPAREHRRQGGRPRADDRMVLEGILWVARSGARWKDLPEFFPSLSTAGADSRNGKKKLYG